MYVKVMKIILIIALIIFVSTVFCYANTSKAVQSAKEIIKKYPEKFAISLERFEKDVNDYPASQVMYASRLAAIYGKNIKEIYEMMKKFEDYRDVGRELARTEEPKQKLPFSNTVTETKSSQPNKRIYDKSIVGNDSPDLTKEEIMELKRAYCERKGIPFVVSKEVQKNKTKRIYPVAEDKRINPTAEEMRELSLEERRKLKESRRDTEWKHDYRYVYDYSLVDKEKNTISHIYHKFCIKGLCANRFGGYYITKGKPLTDEIISMLQKKPFGYIDITIKKELVESIDVAGPYDKEVYKRIHWKMDYYLRL